MAITEDIIEEPYYRVPDQIIEDKARLRNWARKAHGVAMANKK